MLKYFGPSVVFVTTLGNGYEFLIRCAQSQGSKISDKYGLIQYMNTVYFYFIGLTR